MRRRSTGTTRSTAPGTDVGVHVLPDPVWPVLLQAAACLVDGIACIRPIPYIARCLEGVRFPREHWWVFPPSKIGAAVLLVAGPWVPALALLTPAADVLFAIGFHLRARDIGINLFLASPGMLLACVAVGVVSLT